MRKFEYLKVFNSPFKRPKLKWYFGEVAIGTPYFFPRKWVKPTHKMLINKAMEEIASKEDWNKSNPNSTFKHTIPALDELYESYNKESIAVPKKISFDAVSLGYKTKWDDTDYRFEWAPLVSFVFFKWQIAVMVIAPEQHVYWEAWLYYNNNTKGTQRERIEQCKKNFPLDYTVSQGGKSEKVNYYDRILKNKYK
jgi:hypothetical protein